jgi:hypothetical protein
MKKKPKKGIEGKCIICFDRKKINIGTKSEEDCPKCKKK